MRRRRLAQPVAVVGALFAGLVLSGPAAAAGHLVRITSTLTPAALTIAAGDTVTWRNDDDERHRVRSESGPDEFDSGNLEPGESFTVTLTAPGTYAYHDARNDDLARYWGSVTVVTPVSASTPPGGSTDPQPPAAGADGATIGMAGRSFNPPRVTIRAGSTVTFRNDDDRDHTATSTSRAFDSGVLAPGRSWKRTFPAAGTFPFLCAIHPDMTGTVVVTSGTGATPPPAATPAPTRGPAAPTPGSDASEPATARVAIVDLAFTPPDLTIDAGTRVTFENRGAALHTVTADDGSFDSGLIAPGETFERRFASPGTVSFLCSLHPSMTGTIRVRDPNDGDPAPAATAAPDASPAPSDPIASAGGSPEPDGGGPVAAQAGAGGSGGARNPDGSADQAAVRSERPGGLAGILNVAVVAALVLGAILAFTRLVHEAAREPQRP